MAESMFALFKTELFRNPAVLKEVGGRWKGLGDLEIETAKWVSWYNEERLADPMVAGATGSAK